MEELEFDGARTSADKSEERRIMKNITVISVSFLLLFTSFGGLTRLQSSLHRVDGMGVITSSIIYAALVLSCLFLPKMVISKLGHKWTIPVCMSGYTLWMAANGYAVWGTMIPASLLVGLCAAPLWTAQCSYFTKMAARYSRLSGQKESDLVTRFFGIFFMSFQMNAVVSSIISFTVLIPGSPSGSNFTITNDYIQENCGMSYCPYSNLSNPNMEKPPEKTVWILVGVYIALAIGAIIIVSVFVEKLPTDMRTEKVTRSSLVEDLSATVKHLAHTEQLLLIPITMYSGLEQGFLWAEFNLSYITCIMGVHKVGLVTIAGGLVDASVSIGSGYLIKFTGRKPLFLTAFLVDLGIQITLMTWTPQLPQEYVIYLLVAFWGVSDGIWQTQINGMYGSIFPRTTEAAFSNYKVWESLGFIFAFAYSSFLCTDIKLYILTSMLGLGFAGYVLTEIVLRQRKRIKHGVVKSNKSEVKINRQLRMLMSDHD